MTQDQMLAMFTAFNERLDLQARDIDIKVGKVSEDIGKIQRDFGNLSLALGYTQGDVKALPCVDHMRRIADVEVKQREATAVARARKDDAAPAKDLRAKLLLGTSMLVVGGGLGVTWQAFVAIIKGWLGA